jgi:transposase
MYKARRLRRSSDLKVLEPESMQFIGIDVSKKRLHAAWLRDPQQGLTRPKAVDNSPEGHAQLLAWAERTTAAPAGELSFVLEATGVYHEAVALFLHQAGAQVAVTNPLHVKRFAESHGIKTKNDAHDGRVLALYGHERRPKAWQPPPAHVRDLRALLRRLEALEEDRQREANRLEKTQIEGAPDSVLESLQAMLATLGEQIERLRRQIDDHIDRHPDLKAQRAHLETIPGVGPKLSAEFLALFATKRFRDAKQAAAFLGLVPVEHQSGTSLLKRPRLAKNGDSRWRARLFLPALTAARYNADVRALYQRLIAAGKPKMSAAGAAMRKLVQIAFGVFKHQQPYQTQTA